MLAKTAVLLAGLAIALFAWGGSLSDPYLIADDVRQHVYWTEVFRDPDLFPNDLLTRYARSYQPSGFVLLYRVLVPLVPPLTLSKLLPMVLVPITALLVFLFARDCVVRHPVAGRSLGAANESTAATLAGAFAVLLLLLSPSFLRFMAGGLPRGFAFPLLAAFLFCLGRRKPLGLAVATILAAAFYPVVFLVVLFAWGLHTTADIGSNVWRHRARRDRWRLALGVGAPMAASLATAALLGGVIVAGYRWKAAVPEIGSLVSYAEMQGRPEYYRGGYYRALPTRPLWQAALDASAQTMVSISEAEFTLAGERYPVEILAVLVPVAWFAVQVWRRRWSSLKELACLLASACLLYWVAAAVILRLFLPVRYLAYALRLVVILVSGISLGGALASLRWPRTRLLLAAAIVVVLLALGAPGLHNVGMMNTGGPQGLYAFLATLPKPTLIAAPPRLANDIPTFARRQVFVNGELAHPFYDAYWRTIRKRTNDFFTAYYAEDPAAVASFCTTHAIDYLVVDERLLPPDPRGRPRVSFEPFESAVRALVASRDHFALASVPPDLVLFREGPVFVVAANGLREWAGRRVADGR